MKLLFLCILLIGTQSSYAQFYWVGNGGNWSDYEHHWATSSGGNTFWDRIPSKADDVIFDENSFTMDDQEVVLTIYAVTKSWTWSNVLHQPSFNAHSKSLYVYGSLKLQNDVHYDIWGIYLKSVENDATINTAGVFVQSIGIACSGGYILENDLEVQSFRLQYGDFNSNGHDITVTGAISLLEDNHGNINLENSNLRCYSWFDSGAKGTYNSEGSTLYVEGGFLKLNDDNFNTLLYNDLVLKNSVHISGKGNFNHILMDVNEPNVSNEFDEGAVLKCKQLSSNSTKALPLSMICNSESGFATIEQDSGEVNIPYLTLQNIHATGGATFNANPGVDNGNNDGWNFMAIPPLDYFWVGNGGKWSDLNHWATESGGTDKYTALPSKFDNIIFDENSFTSFGQKVEIDMVIVVHDFKTNDVTKMAKLETSRKYSVTINGDLDWSGLEPHIPKLYLSAIDESDMIFPDFTVFQEIELDGGTYQLKSDLNCWSLFLNSGTFYSNGNDITAKQRGITFTGYSTVYLGDSKIDARTFEINTYTTPVDFHADSSTIIVSHSFYGADYSFNDVVLDKMVTVKGNNTIHNLKLMPGTVAQFVAGSNQTILGDITAVGTANQFITIKSKKDGEQSTWTKSSGIVNAKYVNIQDQIATGGATFNAERSVDLGNNTGWNILKPQPRNFYWVGGNGDWSELSHWATTSGGNTYYDELPGQIDNVFFDENSFSQANQIVSVHEDIIIHSLDWTLVAQPEIFKFIDGNLTIYGDCLFTEKVDATIFQLRIKGNDEHHISTGKDNGFGNSMVVYAQSKGEILLDSDINATSIFLEKGVISTQDNNVKLSDEMRFYSHYPKTLKLGSSTLNTLDLVLYGYGDSLTIAGVGGTIECQREFNLLHLNQPKSVNVWLGKLKFSDPSYIGFLNSDVIVDSLVFEVGKEITISPKSSVTVQNLIADGTEDKTIFIHSSENQVPATITKHNGEVICKYLELKDLKGEGGARFIAYNSMDKGNVSGWEFEILPTRQVTYQMMKIQPNPTHDFINMNLPNKKPGQYTIYDIYGKKLVTESFSGKSNLHIDMSSFVNGVYLIQGYSGEEYFRGKVVLE